MYTLSPIPESINPEKFLLFKYIYIPFVSVSSSRWYRDTPREPRRVVESWTKRNFHPPSPPWVYSATVIRVWRLIGRMFGCAQLETIYPYKVLHLAFPYRRHARHETLGGRRGPSETPWTEFNRLCVCCGTGRSCSSPADDASGEKKKRVEPPRRGCCYKDNWENRGWTRRIPLYQSEHAKANTKHQKAKSKKFF